MLRLVSTALTRT